MKIYVYGCITCGTRGVYIKRLVRYCRDNGITVEVINTKYNRELLDQHVGYLRIAGLDLASYLPIVVEDDNVTELKSWKP